MPLSGNLFIALVYLVLFIILGICIVVLVMKKFKNLDLIKFCLLLIVSIAVFRFLQMRETRGMELEYVGKYKLTSYPNCAFCEMQLLRDNTYTIKNSGKIIETGGWSMEIGDDYCVIELSNGNQFGYNKYSNDGKIKN